MITKDSKNILIADDSLFFRTKLSDIILSAGHKVYFAKNGKEVIDWITRFKDLHLLILDLQMPEVDGFGVLKWIDENGWRDKFPVIVVTGAYEMLEVNEKLKGLGYSKFLSKNFPPEQVVYIINQLIFSDKISVGTPRNRVAVSIPVDFTFGTITNTTYIINISEGGVFVNTTNSMLPEGAEVELTFSLPGMPKVLRIKGVVRWFPGEAGYGSMFYGCGIMFTSVPEEAAGLIRSFISKEVDRVQRLTSACFSAVERNEKK